MIIGIPSEIKTGEKRVAMSPANVQSLTDKSVKVLIQANAGSAAGYPDAEYTAAGATITADRAEIFASADIILHCHLRPHVWLCEQRASRPRRSPRMASKVTT